MTRTTLTYDEALLLQRHVDGETTSQEEDRAQDLLERSSPARVYAAALGELRIALQMAEEAAWERAELPSPEEWVDLARDSAGWAEADLDELAPILERFHDGEVDPAEAATVVALMEERDDVAEYLSELDRLSAGVRSAGEAGADVDFDGLWAGIAAQIEGDKSTAPAPIDSFDPVESTVLIHRYHDQEVSDEERRRVDGWLKGGDAEVDGLLGAMAEIHIGVNAGLEVAQEKVDFTDIWTAVESHLDEIDAQNAASNVVSLDKAPDSQARRADSNSWNKPVFASAAAVALIIMGSLIGPQLWQPEQVIETRTVVIFDSVESAPGSSVMIHSPQLASHDGEENDDLPILWVMDDDGDEEYDSDFDDDFDEHPGPI